jgi:hypothetical protein
MIADVSVTRSSRVWTPGLAIRSCEAVSPVAGDCVSTSIPSTSQSTVRFGPTSGPSTVAL